MVGCAYFFLEKHVFVKHPSLHICRLYSTSTLERHHLNQTLVILNLDGNQILKNLNQEEYSATLAVVEEAILATDLSLHFKHLGALKALAAKVKFVDGIN